MKVEKVREIGEAFEPDLTPMIDIVFQLIAFFMVLINFTQVEQDARVTLPISALAKPPEEKREQPLTIQVANINGEFLALVGGDEILVGQPLDGIITRERRAFGRNGRPAKTVTVVLRAHKDTPTGKVQEIIEMCQKHTFEKFRLRVQEDLD